MRTIILLLLVFCNSLYSKSSSNSSTSGNQTENYKSNLKGLLDENGNSIFSLSGTDSLIKITGEAGGNYFGFSVSSAGDVNMDGYSDVIVGAYGYNDVTGRAYIFYGGSFMDYTADVTMTGETISNRFGYSVSSAGDVNGDGYSDVIVGAHSAYINNTGRAYIYYGGSSMDNIADITMTGGAVSNFFGYSVSSAGDVNRDGYSDVIVGAYGYSGNSTGRAYIYFGGSSMDNAADITMTGGATGNYFGFSVSSAGDVNGDGYSDLIVGAYGYSGSTGRTYIYFGGSSMDNVADITMTGEATANYFGYSVFTAGDVNGDGYSDVITGAFGYSNNLGRVYIFYGGSPMNNTADVIITGVTRSIGFGRSVSTGGDVNSDGYSDVIAGAYGYSNNTGRAYIYYGGSSMDNVADVTMTGEAEMNNFGSSVSSAGDVNGNGYSDVIIGAYLFNSSYTGRAYLFVNNKPLPELTYPINSSINNPTIVNFKWRKFDSAIYYILEVSTNSAFNNIIFKDTLYSDTSRTVSGFQKESMYYWRVKAKKSSGVMVISLISDFTTIPPVYVNIKLLFEGMYNPLSNSLNRTEPVTAYLHQNVSPYSITDSAGSDIDSISFTGHFKFYNALSGNYYIAVKHLNSIETWSKSGGQNLLTDGTIHFYDFTDEISQAYGNNLKLKESKYCLYGGDINQDGITDASDVSEVDNDAYNSVSGYVSTDLTGDDFVDAADVSIVDNNAYNSISVIRP